MFDASRAIVSMLARTVFARKMWVDVAGVCCCAERGNGRVRTGEYPENKIA